MAQSLPVEPPDEFDGPPIDRVHVERRVDDWLLRLDQLFDCIQSWATANGWTIAIGRMPMHEELMIKFDIPARSQPTLTLTSPAGAVVFVKPKALWVMGANGRVDLYSPQGAFTMVDVAEQFQPAQWTLHRIGKRNGQPFTPAMIADVA